MLYVYLVTKRNFFYVPQYQIEKLKKKKKNCNFKEVKGKKL